MSQSPSSLSVTPAPLPLATASPFLRIQNVNIFVRDLDRSVAFYRDQLGFKLAFDPGVTSGRRWLIVSPPDGTAMLTLVEPKPGTNEFKLIGRHTQVVFITEDVPAKFREWRKRGVRFRTLPRLRRVRMELETPMQDSPKSAKPGTGPIWGGAVAAFEDLDGNSFTLVSFDAVSRSVDAQRRAAAEKLEAERRVAQELEIAKEVQARFFPQSLPELKTLEYAGVCLQARAVGGDYYDFLPLGRGRLGLVIGDVAGKGIAAALLMASLQASLRSQSRRVRDQAEFLQSVNRFFFENTTDTTYATLFFAEYSDATRRLRYANCGHVAALLLHGDGTLEGLPSTSPVLGFFQEWDCVFEERRLSPGDTLALYTDGITEALDEHGEEFGEARLMQSLRRRRSLPLRALLDAILDDVRQFSPHEQYDDLTLIVARPKS